MLDTTYFYFAASIVRAKDSIQSGLAPVRANGRHAASARRPLDLLESDIGARTIEEIRLEDLPVDWNQVFDHPRCVAIGDEWVAAGRSLGLRVPSALVPEEWNLLLYPAHADASTIRIAMRRLFTFDRRLF